MGDLVVPAVPRIGAMSPLAVEQVRELEGMARQMPQVSVGTDHLIHGGMYARTIMVPAGVMITGALVKVATILIVSGDCTVFIDGGPMDLCGYHVVPASAGRKQAFVANADTWLTAIFPSDARDIDEAERQFTDEYELLSSHRETEINRLTVTGE